jgi:hypothetical protein
MQPIYMFKFYFESIQICSYHVRSQTNAICREYLLLCAIDDILKGPHPRTAETAS